MHRHTHEHVHKEEKKIDHLDEIKRKALVCSLLTLPVVLLSPTFQELLGISLPEFYGSKELVLLLSSLIFFYGGIFFIRGFLQEIKVLRPGMMSLVSIAISVGFLYSLYAHILGGMDFFWELSTLITVMLWGHFIEMKSVLGASRALEELARLLPKKANLIKGSEVLEVDVEKLKVGNVVLVRPGEKVPADGIILEGKAHINEALLTGESKPVSKGEGDRVIGGSLNMDDLLKVKVEKTGEEAYLSQVMKIVKQAQESKTRLQDLADRFAFYLTLLAVLVGTVTFSLWLYLKDDPNFAIERAVTVIVIACPHALGLAIPLVVAISTSYASSKGILIRDRLSLELLRKVDVVVFDKTGTLTEGKFGLSEILIKDMEELELLRLVASLERNSEHVIAKAIVEEAVKKKLELLPVEDFKTYPGRGVLGRVKGREVAVGTEIFIRELGIQEDEELLTKSKGLKGRTLVFVGVDGRLAGILGLSDRIRGESYGAVKSIKELGKKVMMITGDREEVAQWVSEELGIDEYFARVLPHQKADIVKGLQKRGLKVAMVGDGVNDAPALMQADVGIAIGSGTDVAIESAGIILVKSNPEDVLRSLRLSQLSYKKMTQNLFWATGYNLFAIPLAGGLFYRWGLLLPPTLGAIFMSLSTVLVAINALLMRRSLQ
ncbi:MAG: heavy metal translocating P-type ATPase [Aquificaceae bacterium]